jgi:DNA-binding XRE family transcriptional regulator
MPGGLLYFTDTMTGKELRRARARLKMTQKELARELEVHWNTIARAERGELPVLKTTELAVMFLLVRESKPKRGRTNGRRR